MNPRSLAAYLAERFPVVNMGLFAILFLTVWSVAGRGTGSFGVREAGGILATISFFFRLRVFDEIKDYASDSIHYPDRVLQSGRVTLGQLSTLAAVGAVFEAGWSAWMGTPALLGWLGAVGYSLAMRYEFFVSDFLKKRLVLYALTHLLIMPLVIAWLWTAYAPGFPGRFALLAALSLLGGGAFEVARKIHAPEAERPGVDSYSRALGYRGAIVTVLAVLLLGLLVQRVLLDEIGARRWPFDVIILLSVLTGMTYVRAWTQPEETSLRRAELLVSLFMLASYLTLMVELSFSS